MEPKPQRRFPWWLGLALASGLLIGPLVGDGETRAGPPRARDAVYRGVQLPATLSASERKAVRLALDTLHGKSELGLQKKRCWRHELGGIALMAKPYVTNDAIIVFFKTDRKRALHDLLVVDLALGPKGPMPANVDMHHVFAQVGGVTVTRAGLAYEMTDFQILALGENIEGGRVPLTDLSHAGRPPDDGCHFFEGRTKRRLTDTVFVKRKMWRKLCVKKGKITLGDEVFPEPSTNSDPPSHGMGPDREDH